MPHWRIHFPLMLEGEKEWFLILNTIKFTLSTQMWFDETEDLIQWWKQKVPYRQWRGRNEQTIWLSNFPPNTVEKTKQIEC